MGIKDNMFNLRKNSALLLIVAFAFVVNSTVLTSAVRAADTPVDTEKFDDWSVMGPDGGDVRVVAIDPRDCLLYTSPSPRDRTRSRMPSSA